MYKVHGGTGMGNLVMQTVKQRGIERSILYSVLRVEGFLSGFYRTEKIRYFFVSETQLSNLKLDHMSHACQGVARVRHCHLAKALMTEQI